MVPYRLCRFRAKFKAICYNSNHPLVLSAAHIYVDPMYIKSDNSKAFLLVLYIQIVLHMESSKQSCSASGVIPTKLYSLEATLYSLCPQLCFAAPAWLPPISLARPFASLLPFWLQQLSQQFWWEQGEHSGQEHLQLLRPLKPVEGHEQEWDRPTAGTRTLHSARPQSHLWCLWPTSWNPLHSDAWIRVSRALEATSWTHKLGARISTETSSNPGSQRAKRHGCGTITTVKQY